VPAGRPLVTAPSDPVGSDGTASTGGSDGTETPTQIAELWKSADPGSSDSRTAVMTAIAMAESSGSTTVVNSIGCVGLWQINVPAHPQYTQSDMQDPTKNAAAAVAILKGQGLTAWQTYTDGAYKQYLATAKKATSDAKGTGPDVAGAVEDAAGDVAGEVEGEVDSVWDTARFLKDAGDLLFTQKGWMRLLKLGGGIVLGVFALHQLFEGSVIGDTAGTGVGKIKSLIPEAIE
jgi:hypothetical protein